MDSQKVSRGARRPAGWVGGARGARRRRRARPGLGPTRPHHTAPENPRAAGAAPVTPADLCPALGSGRGLRGGNRGRHRGPRRPLRALGPFLPAARSVLRGASLLGRREDRGSVSRGNLPAGTGAGVLFHPPSLQHGPCSVGPGDRISFVPLPTALLVAYL